MVCWSPRDGLRIAVPAPGRVSRSEAAPSAIGDVDATPGDGMLAERHRIFCVVSRALAQARRRSGGGRLHIQERA
jgi:hypothetical protein